MAGLSDASAWDSGPSIYSVPGLQPHWGSLKSAGLTFLSQIPLSLDKLMQICSVKSANSILQIVQDYNQVNILFLAYLRNTYMTCQSVKNIIPDYNLIYTCLNGGP
jgi:hypothetical protein